MSMIEKNKLQFSTQNFHLNENDKKKKYILKFRKC